MGHLFCNHKFLHFLNYNIQMSNIGLRDIIFNLKPRNWGGPKNWQNDKIKIM